MSATRLILCETLLESARAEKQIEIIRQLLCELPLFHPYSAFKTLHNGKGYIDHLDLQQLLSRNGFGGYNCTVYIQNYDQDLDGTLTYAEFLRSILPNMHQDLRQSITLKQPFISELDPQVEYTIARLIDKEINLTLALDPIKRRLAAQPDFTACFSLIDSIRCDKLIIRDFEQFFVESQLIIYPDELVAMFKRIDIKQDGIVDAEEFYRFLQIKMATQPVFTTPTKQVQPKLVPTQSPPKKAFQSSAKRFSKPVIVEPPIDPPRRKKNPEPSKGKPRKSSSEPKQQQKYFDYKTKLRAEVNKVKAATTNVKTQAKPTPKSATKPHPTNKVTKQSKPKPAEKQLDSPAYVLAKRLYATMEREALLELTKQNLSLRDDFNLFDGFAAFDEDRLGYVTCQDLDTKLGQQNGAFQTLIVRFGHKGRLDFTRFVQIVQPQSPEYADMLRARHESHYNYSQVAFTEETRQLLAKVLLLTNEREQSILAQKNPQSASKELFEQVDAFSKDGLLDVEDFMEFFSRNNLKGARTDVGLLIKLMDRNEDGRISLMEFMSFLSV